MKSRYVIVTIDTIAEIMKDYVANEADIPSDAMPTKLLINPTTKKFALELVSEHFKPDCTPLNVTFDIKRVFSAF